MPDQPDDREQRPGNDRPDTQHPAGPHAKPELTDYDKTPGTGSLPDDTDAEGDLGPD